MLHYFIYSYVQSVHMAVSKCAYDYVVYLLCFINISMLLLLLLLLFHIALFAKWLIIINIILTISALSLWCRCGWRCRRSDE